MRTFLGGVLGKIPRPTPAMVVALLALLVAASGVAVAAGSYTASDGTITACRDNKTGVLRVIQSGQNCTSKETTITWKDGITGKVADADKLDGQDSTAFLGANQKAADSDKLDNMDSTEFLGANQTAADSAKLGGQSPSAYLGANQKAADSDKLDGLDSTAFAAANHNHDSSYIQQSPSSPENASINITGRIKTSGMLDVGSGTGTMPYFRSSALPTNELIVRRLTNDLQITGSVVARTDELRLQRDGTRGGLMIAWDAGADPSNSVSCMGIDDSGQFVSRDITPVPSADAPAGTTQLFWEGQRVTYLSCSFGDSSNARHVTQVTMQRRPASDIWVGTLISSYNQ